MSALCEDAQGRPGGGGQSGGALAGDGGEGRQLRCPLLCLQCTPEGFGAPRWPSWALGLARLPGPGPLPSGEKGRREPASPRPGLCGGRARGGLCPAHAGSAAG